MTTKNVVKAVIEALDESALRLDKATVDQLAESRQRAVATAERVHSAPQLAIVGAGHFSFNDSRPWRSWMAAVLLLLLAWLLIQQNIHRGALEQDALLLASELPPEAYLDKGFDAWLERSLEP